MNPPVTVTLEYLEKLDAAIALGIRRVEYHDKIVEYMSLNDMFRARRFIVASLFPGGRRGRVYASVSKGTRP